MKDGFKIEKATSVDDTIVLDILEKMTDNLGTKFSTKAKKLLSKIKNDTQNPIYAKLNIEDISDYLHEIAILENAIKEKNIIKAIYNHPNCTRHLKIKPLKIVNYEGIWYLLALNAKNDKLRKYHLKSISNIEVLEDTFTTKKELNKLLETSINVWFNDEVEPYEVVLFLNKHAAKTLKRRPLSKSQRVISEYQDGSCDISLWITHEKEIIPIVQYWMPHIKIVSPDWINEMILDHINRFLK